MHKVRGVVASGSMLMVKGCRHCAEDLDRRLVVWVQGRTTLALRKLLLQSTGRRGVCRESSEPLEEADVFSVCAFR